MHFLRSLGGGRRGERDEPDSGSGAAADSAAPTSDRRPEPTTGRLTDSAPGPQPARATEPPTDDARAAELMDEFEAGLSELAQRQLRFSRFAWEPPAQLDRRGRWVLLGAADATDEAGKRVALRAGEGLELDELGEDEAGREAWRFVRVKDGRTVWLEAGPAGAWPDGLERPRKGAEGS